MTSPLGLDLDVLDAGAARLERALELVNVVRAAARELDELVNDPNDPVVAALEQAAAHRNGAEPALELSPPPAPPEPPAEPPPAAARRPRSTQPVRAAALIVDHLEAHPGEWFSSGQLCRELELSRSSTGRALRELVETETVESNGAVTSSRRYRLDPDLADAAAPSDEDEPAARRAAPTQPPPDPEPAAPAEPAEPEDDDDDDPAPTREDVRRSIERVSGLAPPRRSSVLPRPAATLSGPQGAAREELKDRIRAKLLEEACTVSELALALDVPRRDVAPVLTELVEDPNETVERAGVRLNIGRRSGEPAYTNTA